MKRRFQITFVRSASAAIFIVVLAISALAQEQPQTFASLNYRLSMSRPVSHLFEVGIEVTLSGETRVGYIDFQMPKWSPGRYGVFDFAKNVQEFVASADICPPDTKCKRGPLLPVVRFNDQTWRVETRGQKQLTITYKVYGDDLSGTFSQLNERHANYNGASIFMYIVGHKQNPVTLNITAPPNWRIVNGWTERTDQTAWQFPNYDLLIDTPTEIAPDWTVDEFKVDGKTYRVVVHSFGDEGGKRSALVEGIEKIVRAETKMWGAPEFDTYTFLIHFAADDHSGDGMEHLTSTQIIQPGALADPGTLEGTLDTAAHEFFHVWNVKRLRPIELGPWDFTRPLSTRGLWIAEGITTYYGFLMQQRAGIWEEEQFIHALGQIISEVENAPGSRLMSAEESSTLAPFLDRSTHEQRTNLLNTSISYYPKGAMLGLVLDALIRGKTKGRASLDDVMRRMYEEFYVKSPKATYYLRGRGYTNEDFERMTSEVAGTDMSDFFKRYVRGTETPPYDEAFAPLGLSLVRAPAPYTAGIIMDWEDAQNVRIRSVRNGSPAEDAGLSPGDVLVSIGGTNVTRETWRTTLNRHKQGERIPVTIKRDRRTIQTFITLGTPDRYEYRLEEIKNVSKDAVALRTAWLKG